MTGAAAVPLQDGGDPGHQGRAAARSAVRAETGTETGAEPMMHLVAVRVALGRSGAAPSGGEKMPRPNLARL